MAATPNKNTIMVRIDSETESIENKENLQKVTNVYTFLYFFAVLLLIALYLQFAAHF